MTMFAAQPDPEAVSGYSEAGVTRAVFPLPARGPDVVLPELDKLAELIR
jgi:hypothetical protein